MYKPLLYHKIHANIIKSEVTLSVKLSLLNCCSDVNKDNSILKKGNRTVIADIHAGVTASIF